MTITTVTTITEFGRCDGRDACAGVSRPSPTRENEGGLPFRTRRPCPDPIPSSRYPFLAYASRITSKLPGARPAEVAAALLLHALHP